MAYYSNGSKVIEGGFIVSGLDQPEWVTPAGSIATIYDKSRTLYSLSVSATASNPVSYSVTGGSLPTGMSLNTTGTFTGTPNAVGTDTTYTFTITATSTLSTSREFSITIKAPITQTYNYSGSNQTFTIPDGVDGVQAYMWGAAGGGSNAEGFSDPGGPGGYAEGLINVSAFTSIVIQVGEGGKSASTSRPSRPYPHGGQMSLRSGYTSGSGGGRTAIFANSVSHSNSLLIAAGGGGAAGHGGGASYASEGGHGGGGGGTNGEQGYSTYTSQPNNGASQSAGGAGNSPGAALQGADAGDGTLWSAGWNAAGGGGDGYYGGGANNNFHQGGGGGSGYANTTYVSSASLQGTTVGNARVSSTNPPQTGSTYYSTGIGRGNSATTGGNGKCVIIY